LRGRRGPLFLDWDQAGIGPANLPPVFSKWADKNHSMLEQTAAKTRANLCPLSRKSILRTGGALASSRPPAFPNRRSLRLVSLMCCNKINTKLDRRNPSRESPPLERELANHRVCRLRSAVLFPDLLGGFSFGASGVVVGDPPGPNSSPRMRFPCCRMRSRPAASRRSRARTRGGPPTRGLAALSHGADPRARRALPSPISVRASVRRRSGIGLGSAGGDGPRHSNRRRIPRTLALHARCLQQPMNPETIEPGPSWIT